MRKAKLYHELTTTVTLASPRNRSHNIFYSSPFVASFLAYDHPDQPDTKYPSSKSTGARSLHSATQPD